jgi:hypothetical protein
MDRDNRPRAVIDAFAQLNGVHAEIDGVDIDKDRGGAEARHHPCGGEEGEGRQDHLIAPADAEGHEGHEQRIGPRGDTDRVQCFECRRRLAFKVVDLGAEDEALGVADSIDGLADLLTQGFVLSRQIEQRHGHSTHLHYRTLHRLPRKQGRRLWGHELWGYGALPISAP